MKQDEQDDVIEVQYGTLTPRPDNAVLVTCHVCGTEHERWGFARVIHNTKVTAVVLLCQGCLPSSDDSEDAIGSTDHSVIQKYLDSLDLEIRDGGQATTEQAAAIVERQGKTQH